MEANELRINNLVFGPDKETICTVKYIDGEENTISTDKYSERPTVDFHPIPLNEEWLLKFGFISVTGQIYDPNDEYPERFYYELDSAFKNKEFLCFPFYGWTVTLGNEGDEREIEFCHDLQNLFFALKGKELTLK